MASALKKTVPTPFCRRDTIKRKDVGNRVGNFYLPKLRFYSRLAARKVAPLTIDACEGVSCRE